MSKDEPINIRKNSNLNEKNASLQKYKNMNYIINI